MEKAAVKEKKTGAVSLFPLFVFFALYLGVSLCAGDFYKMPITVAFLAGAVVSIAMYRGVPLGKRIKRFSEGASHSNIMLMVWIFVLAGAFAQAAKATGAIDATVNMTLSILPGDLLLAGIFIASCFISLAVGTSVGTIAALTPVAAGIAAKTGVDPAFMTAVVVGGSFFGDNLSFISDTTIAATKTQGCMMKDKFRANLMIVLPAVLLVLVFYIFKGTGMHWDSGEVPAEDYFLVLPYLIVLVCAVCGMDVTAVLVLGIASTGITGMAAGEGGFWPWLSALGEGIKGMGELIIVTLLAAGMLEMIRANGGMDYIISHLTRRVSTRRGAELSIAALVSLTNMCTANNTVAIITVGQIARDISSRFGIDPRKTASILDTFSCFVQGLIPYGAQVLIASSLAGVSPLSIIGSLYYPMLMGVFATAAIIFRYPKRISR